MFVEQQQQQHHRLLKYANKLYLSVFIFIINLKIYNFVPNEAMPGLPVGAAWAYD